MGGTPSVSVIMPTYERRELVARAVESVLAQTHADLELIVVDDGSTDGTFHALRSCDPRVRCHRQPNRGVGAARNTGVRLARAPLVAFLDSDDRWLPDHLAASIGTLRLRPEAVLVSTTPRHRAEGRAEPGDAVLLDALPACLYGNPVGWPSAIAVRRDDLLAVGGFDERLRVGEGGELWARLARRGPFALLERRTVVKRRSPGGLVERWRDSGAFLDALAATTARALPGRATDGAVRFVDALHALARDDRPAAAEALAAACELLPQLDRDPESVAHRLSLLQGAGDRAVRRARLATAAAAWPDPSSRTARGLRGEPVDRTLADYASDLDGSAAAAIASNRPATAAGSSVPERELASARAAYDA